MSENTLYKIYSIKSYYGANDEFINNNYEEYELEELVELLLKRDNGYHQRIHKKTFYIFFGDLDGYNKEFDEFQNKLINFLKKSYAIIITKKDIMYTKNKSKNGSYHYSVPGLHCSCEKLKEILKNFKKQYIDDFKYKKEEKIVNCIDTTIYAEHWFRLPLQSKEANKSTLHEIIKGNMRDFIVEYIPDDSLNIEDFKIIYHKGKQVSNTQKTASKKIIPIVQDIQKTPDTTNTQNTKVVQDKLDAVLKKSKNYKLYIKYKEIFDKCYSQERFDCYEYWTTVGMALKNIYDIDAFPLFDYFSSKSTKYEGRETVLYKYKSFRYADTTCKNIGSLYKMAKEDNINEYKKIMYIDDISLLETDFAEKINELAGDSFMYIKLANKNYQLYCYTGKYWENDDLLLRKYISTELYDYYQNLIIDVYWNSPNFKKLKTQIDGLKRLATKRNIVELYKEYGIRNIIFDDKWWLLGFNNQVYDIKEHIFRDYLKDDYVSITVGYDWIEPLAEEINILNDIIKQIMPIESERNFYKSILSTSLEGRCLEKFIVFNGCGRNGKGLIDDLLIIALGSYALAGNNSILFEKCKTGSNPELANMDKKRLVIFKEPSEKSKFENSIVKALTGGGQFSARTHNEKETEKTLHNTTICECNKRPLFTEEPDHAEVKRIIDILFRSTFDEDLTLVDEKDLIFEAKPEFKESQFQQKHKCALLQILMDSHKIYAQNKYKFDMPDSIKKRTAEYLELSCNLLQWFKDNHELTNKKNDYVKLKDLYEDFKMSEYYDNITKLEKRKYNYKYFVEYFSTNIISKKYYKEKTTDLRNVLFCWKKFDCDEFTENNKLDFN